MSIDRRQVLRSMLGAGASLVIPRAFANFESFASPSASAYGPLSPKRAANTGELLLALPDGFQYTVFGRGGDQMSDRNPTPRRPDGMAAFLVGGELRLVRNHEVPGPGPRITQALPFYDARGQGGTTTVVIDPVQRSIVRHYVSLSGTSNNCAGGATPWGSWITCEETTAGEASGLLKPHGYCFEVPAAAELPVDAVPLRAMGRFVHEAVAVDPLTGFVYLTEDQPDAGFYRFVPDEKGQLSAGGPLQILSVAGQPNYNTGTGQQIERLLPVVWLDIPQPDPPDAEQFRDAVYRQGRQAGAARFTRLEGAWAAGGRILFVSTIGGNRGFGQLWEYLPGSSFRRRAVRRTTSPAPEGYLRLICESDNPEILRNPDNICMSPDGTLILCEDSLIGRQHLRGLTAHGELFDLARYEGRLAENCEFTGATFSPDGQTLFVNLQLIHATLAIWGDW